MSHTVIQNSTASQEPPHPPQHPEGGQWLYEMIYNDGDARAYADTTIDLMDVLSPGYTQLTPLERAHARITLAEMARITAQASFLSTLHEPLTTEQQQQLNQQPFTGHWDGPIPLVTINTHYTPHTPLTPPTSGTFTGGLHKIVTLDVSTEHTLLEGLHDIGNITLATRTPPDLT